MYNLVYFWLFLIKFLSHVLTGRTEGNAANTNLTNARWMGHSLMEWWCFTIQWSAPCQESWTSPITWPHRACHRPLGSVQPLLRRPGLQSNSKVQVINRRIVSVTTSRNMNVMSLDIFINLSIGISLTVFVCICLKVFVCYYLVIACIFLKVFVCYYLESNRLHFFESIRLLLLGK